GSANTENLSFDRIELTDSSTILHGVVHFRPGWWVRISPTSEIRVDGTAYPLVSIDGAVAGENITVPDSGVIHFAMTFPAIPADAKSLDFSENLADGWEIWDIDLTGQASHDYNLKAVPSKARNNSDRPLPATTLAYGDSTVINIHLLGYRPAMGDKLNWIVNTLHGQTGIDTPLSIDSTGNAILKLDLSAPAQFIPISLNNGSVNFGSGIFVAPGETLNVYVDTHTSGIRNMQIRDGLTSLAEDYTSVYSDGSYPRLEREVAMPLYSGNFADYHMDGDAYTAYILDLYKTLNDSIDANPDLSDAARSYNKACLTADLISAASNAISHLTRNYISTNKLSRNERVPYDSINCRLSPENVRAIASVIDFNNPDLLLSDEFPRNSTYIWDDAGIDTGFLKVAKAYGR
ncbi:MAG: hypothetical protein K2K77_07875, partial [Duncaniella sp.]|nr:hypothetical protein [Duncaniella sp.]